MAVRRGEGGLTLAVADDAMAVTDALLPPSLPLLARQTMSSSSVLQKEWEARGNTKGQKTRGVRSERQTAISARLSGPRIGYGTVKVVKFTKYHEAHMKCALQTVQSLKCCLEQYPTFVLWWQNMARVGHPILGEGYVGRAGCSLPCPRCM